ncbi:amidohydrolase [Novosphingobium beihaiensis]|uniref:Amidohydrolase n=1 Tax=Novosphingobium beihaiensis TaxID=2930389 RepID=A0ABT0BM96_9SPHN|nr:amidohydrolase [Novosphingobium beihaiensis]MCJ2185834.1 amidohydrolase [Novosphingobium beihaiensis]
MIAAALLVLSHAPAAHAAAKADMVLYGGQVVTMDPDRPSASAVAVRDGKIVAVGGDGIASQYDAAETIDLKGRMLMPGFIDTHVHIIGQPRRAVDLSKAHSIAGIQQLVRDKARELGKGEWITGYGWDEAQLAEKRNIVSTDLDEAAPDNPVALTRAGSHSIAGNSMAMRLAGIGRTTPNPDHGVIEHFANGEPNGIIRERTDLYSKLVPPPAAGEMKPSFVARLKALLPLGITSLMEALTTIDDEPVGKGGIAGGKGPSTAPTFRQFREIYAEQGESLPRATLYIFYPGAERLKAFPYHTGYGDDRLKLGPIGEGLFADGGFTGPTAWTLQDYKGMPGFRGRAATPPDELRAMVRTARDLGWQLGIHAIGDAAIQRLVGIYAQALAEKPQKDARWFTAHLTMLPPPETLSLMASHGIWAAVQPNFLYNLEGRYNETLEGERLQHINPVGTPLRWGVHLAFGSDNLPIGPLYGFYVAVTRKGQSGTVYGADEAVSRIAALRAYTQDAAWLTWDEKKKGSLTPGKLADMIVLDHNLLTVPEEEILDTRVDITIVGGKTVYRRQPEQGRPDAGA